MSSKASGKRTMLVRTALHGMSTIAGLVSMQMMHDAPMWFRMTMYAGSWIACTALYLPVLYVREHIVDAWDDHTRQIVRDELERRDLLDYQREIDRAFRHTGNDD